MSAQELEAKVKAAEQKGVADAESLWQRIHNWFDAELAKLEGKSGEMEGAATSTSQTAEAESTAAAGDPAGAAAGG